jgi:hypothetical protein
MSNNFEVPPMAPTAPEGDSVQSVLVDEGIARTLRAEYELADLDPRVADQHGIKPPQPSKVERGENPWD